MENKSVRVVLNAQINKKSYTRIIELHSASGKLMRDDWFTVLRKDTQ